MVQQPLVGQGLPIIEASLSNSEDTQHSVGPLWKSDQPDAEISENTQHSKATDIHVPGGVQTRNPSKRATLDRAATGVGCLCIYSYNSQTK